MKKLTEINTVRVIKRTISSTFFIRLRFHGYWWKSGITIFAFGNISSIKQKQTKVCGFHNIFCASSKFYKSKKLLINKFLKFWSSINIPCGHVRSHTKFELDWFSRFDVYWILTNKQTPIQVKFIHRCAKKYYEIRKFFVLFCFILCKEKMLTDKATIKSWNRRWARSALKPSIEYS